MYVYIYNKRRRHGHGRMRVGPPRMQRTKKTRRQDNNAKWRYKLLIVVARLDGVNWPTARVARLLAYSRHDELVAGVRSHVQSEEPIIEFQMNHKQSSILWTNLYYSQSAMALNNRFIIALCYIAEITFNYTTLIFYFIIFYLLLRLYATDNNSE